ncbi:S-adenosyl-L-methionine-dependent methyltransferase [Melampsora americana]|nr:S-adenosyl-L-methionine-dependent methyltransferase [Melampsora americana]
MATPQDLPSQILSQNRQVAKPFWVDKLKSEAPKNWDLFYKTHENKFFKDRNWTLIEFEEFQNLKDFKMCDLLEHQDKTNFILEVGCGVGNLIWPLIFKFSNTNFYCFDFSNRAIEILKSHSSFHSSRIHPFVFDLTSTSPSLDEKLKEPSINFHPTSSPSVDLISCVFVFSALPPEKHQLSAQNLIDVLNPGGTILFRDYAINDAAQLRFHQRPSSSYTSVPSLLSEDQAFYKRADGTFSYFFSIDEVRALFSPSLDCLECEINERQIVNRKQGIKVPRKFIQARFRKRLA